MVYIPVFEFFKQFGFRICVNEGHGNSEDDDADEDYEAEDEPAGEEKSADPEIEKEINEMMDEAEKAAKADEALDIDAD